MTMQLPKHIKALAAAALISLPAVAQNTNSGYFVDDYTYRFQSNPAFANSKNFVAMPGLGNVNVAMQGNLATSSTTSTAAQPPSSTPPSPSRKS